MRSVRALKTAFIAFFALAILFVPAILFAASNVTFFMQNWVNINLNEEPVTLPLITITDPSGTEVTAKNGIGIMIPSQQIQALWDKTVTQLTLDGVKRDISYSSDLKTVRIPVQADFTAGQRMTIEGLTMRVYDQGATYQNFLVDVNNDGVGDFEGTNGFLIDATNRRTDRTAPFEVDNLKSVYANGKVTLSWVNPLDYDLDKILITRDLTRVDGSKDQSVAEFSRLTIQYEDAVAKVGESISYKVSTKDYNGNSSTGLVISLIIGEEPKAENPLPEEQPAEEQDVDMPEEPSPVSVIDTVGDDDIAGATKPGSGLLPTSEHVKQVVYLLKQGWLTPNYRGSLRLVRHLKYGEFADIVGPAFNVDVPGNSKNAYYFAMKKQMPELMPDAVRASDRVTREAAFRILLKLANVEVGSQTLVSDPASLRWYLTRSELAIWVVGLIDIKG